VQLGQPLRDVSRYTKLVDLGRRSYRSTKLEVYGQRERIIAS
jgi:hypothetical protein